MGTVSISAIPGEIEIGRRTVTTGIGAGMTGLDFMANVEGCPSVPYICPIIAGASLSMTAAMAVVDWTQLSAQAAGALALAGMVGGGIVAGIVYAIRKYDLVQIERQKLYDDANRNSLSKQIEDLKEQNRIANQHSLSNQEHQRVSLHQLRNDAQRAQIENEGLRENLTTLRNQFMQVSKDLRETDQLLHDSNEKIREMTVLLQETSKDRDALRAELDSLRKELGAFRKTQVVQGAQIKALEQVSGSSDSIPILPPQVDSKSTSPQSQP